MYIQIYISVRLKILNRIILLLRRKVSPMYLDHTNE